ncbi:glutathione ABC transporter permease GsiD [Brenneria goodwinii]|uniref:Glutathione transport system permease protein GsiD n=1 Tax=Brenneria goodwinii TaxID=1109412 RepID=A0A0G4JTR4_9GAMM|nr:ABC transporter permease subunit [Brenneria goodwinii]ATA26124.1 glutathione ABC transporter permease [Brenneria goodwinii]MCG8158510.1 ABC transporter permease subunit [Brenneria goodwinii]MCG8163084.1 ABC transporter permease subunit [Brenneria goodwinii]MCG8167630.1 ABC transporter permease subunit [Brenneria goodwinii]MCG8172221.1 ABC transporter permease subunit [Brenneria goodwinii]
MNLPSEPAVAAATLDENTIRSPWRDFAQVFFHNPMALASGGFILLLILVAILAPWLAPYNPQEPDWMALSSPPSAAHWMGTDDLGRDVMSRIIYGARISLYIGIFSVTLGMLAGIVLGLLAGYYGRWIDMLIMRGSDVLFAFPGMLLAIAVVAILGPGLNNVIIAVAVFSVPVFARIVRASTLSLKQAAYVEAVRCAGAPDRIVLMRHILPGTLPSVIVYFTMRIGTSILTAASLSFIGLGPEPDVPEWGNILAMSRSLMMAGLWHVSVFPGLAIFFTVLAFNLLGDALRDTLDPKLKS